jgi:NCAIR mutase (PurE)-related protein
MTTSLPPEDEVPSPADQAVTAQVTLDTQRTERLGFDEAIYSAGKSVAQLDLIAQRLRNDGQRGLFTRLDAEQHDSLTAEHRAYMDYDPVSRTGILGNGATRVRPTEQAAQHVGSTTTGPRVAVVTAGTSDVPVAREAIRTLGYYAQPCLEIYDVGVAGLWRLLERAKELRDVDVVIAVAGMDAALPSVLGGLVPGAIIAVPTSTGYGVAHDGVSALHASLASCAPGVLVVNIDNGYGAACAALRICAMQTRALAASSAPPSS